MKHGAGVSASVSASASVWECTEGVHRSRVCNSKNRKSICGGQSFYGGLPQIN